MPVIRTRDSIKTHSAEDKDSIFSHSKITIKVPRYEIKKGGFFSSDYSMFLVETEMIDGLKKDRARVFRKD
jgi:hypothetical protein